MSGFVSYRNGEIVPTEGLSLPIDDQGVLWGALVVDRLRTHRGILFDLDRAIARFLQSAALASIPVRETTAELAAAVQSIVSANQPKIHGGDDLSVVLIGSPGSAWADRPTLMIAAERFDIERYRRTIESGVRLRSVSASLGTDARIKHRSRLPWWIARHQIAVSDPGCEPLFLDDAGHVAETANANILFRIDERFVTPPSPPSLSGISLASVMEVCRSLGMDVEVRPVSMAQARRARSAWISNVSLGIAGVAEVDGMALRSFDEIYAKLKSGLDLKYGHDIHHGIVSGC